MTAGPETFSFWNRPPGFIAEWIRARREAQFDRTALSRVGSALTLWYAIVSAGLIGATALFASTTTLAAVVVVLGVTYIAGRWVFRRAWKLRKMGYREDLREAHRNNRS